jgi:UDPglucose 6-dehydrogenase
MKIGIIGLGAVGQALKKGFEFIEHDIYVHDVKFNTKITNCLDTEIIFICLPTPFSSSNACDTHAIETCLNQLEDLNYKGICAIKSTVVPGFTEKMISRHKNLKICFTPEFLREKYGEVDFVKNQKILAVGTDNTEIYNKILDAHGSLPFVKQKMSAAEAEILKYMTNCYSALKVTFGNIFYEYAERLDCNYNNIKEAFVQTERTANCYLDVNSELRGFGGRCLPKDLNCFNETLKNENLKFTLLDAIIADNKKFNNI